MSEKKGHRS